MSPAARPSARVARRRGDARRLAEGVAGVQLRRPRLTAAIPSISALTLLQLSAFTSPRATRLAPILRDVSDLLRERPDLGIVGDVAKRLAEQMRTLPINIAGASTASLTPAELRLPPHLRFPEVGARLLLSHHTFKTQGTSIYRKLDL